MLGPVTEQGERPAAGVERPDLYDVAFGESLHGKSVLHVGSSLGSFCVEALARGAAEAVGLDVDPDRIAAATEAAEIKGLKPAYQQGDIEAFEPAQQFDIVVCINVLHHVFDPIAVLHKLGKMTREKLVLEVATPAEHDAAAFGFPRRFRWAHSRLPSMYVGPGAPLTRRRTMSQKFFLSEQAIERILSSHMKMFYKVEIAPSPLKGRFIVTATRRRIDQLLVVSGPTSSGKTTFLKQLRTGELPNDVRATLPESSSRWPQVGANRLFRSPLLSNDGRPLDEPYLDGLALHYDILRPRTTGTHNHDRDQSLDLLDCARDVTIVVLRPDTDQLIKQLVKNELDSQRERTSTRTGPRRNALTSLAAAVPRMVRRWLARVAPLRRFYATVQGGQDRSEAEELLAYYERDGWLDDWYDRWSGYLAERHPAAAVVDVTLPIAGD